MNKEQQDKLWNELSEEQRAEYREEFLQETEKYSANLKHCDNENDFEYCTGYSNGVVTTLEDLFGEHNLNSRRIKTWEDLEKEYPEYRHDISDLAKIACVDMRILCKLIATYKIAKLIDLGYGGMVSEEEWKDEYKSKWVINCDMSKETRFEILEMFVDKFFIAFHEESQAEEFMSHESNIKLVEQYHMV